MRHGSLFSGIGGFDLAATWMGWENVFQCERDPFCRRILNFYWPNAKYYEDVREFDATIYRGSVDIVTGGFPCQPFSAAGKRKGTADDRYLWPEMCRIIGEVRPRWIVGENVLGLLSWRKGLVFEQVLADLEAAGYTAWPYILPAAGVGAPHRRDRVWIVAYSGREFGDGRKGAKDERVNNREGAEWDEKANFAEGLCTSRSAADADCIIGRERWLHAARSEAAERYPCPCDPRDFRNTWENFPTESPVRSGDDGLSGKLDRITLGKWREESIKAAGNAIVPQVVFEIFKVIEKMEAI